MLLSRQLKLTTLRGEEEIDAPIRYVNVRVMDPKSGEEVTSVSSRSPNDIG